MIIIGTSAITQQHTRRQQWYKFVVRISSCSLSNTSDFQTYARLVQKTSHNY